MVNSKNVALAIGSTPPPETLRLLAQNVPIKGAIVDNANSSITVLVYQGFSPTGTPIVILPGWSRGFTVDGTSALYVVFSGTPTAVGNVALAWSSEPQAAFSSTILSTISGIVAVEFVSDFPIPPSGAAVQWEANGVDAATSAGPYVLFSQSPTLVNGYYYLTAARMGNANSTRLSWLVQLGGATLPLAAWAGVGDSSGDLVKPFLLGRGQASGPQTVILAFPDPPLVNPVNVTYSFAGYFLGSE